MNRRGQIGAGLTWFAAFIIVFFVMLLFISATVALAQLKKVSITEWRMGAQRSGTFSGEQLSLTLNAEKNLMEGLNSRANYNGENVKISDIVAMIGVFKDAKEQEQLTQIVYPAFNNPCKDYLLAMEGVWIYSMDGKNGFGKTAELSAAMKTKQLSNFESALTNVTDASGQQIEVGYIEIIQNLEGCK